MDLTRHRIKRARKLLPIEEEMKRGNFKLDQIDQMSDEINWKWVSGHCILPIQIIERYWNKLDISTVCLTQKLTPIFLTNHQSTVDWNTVSLAQNLTDDEIYTFHDHLNLALVSQNLAWRNLSWECIEKFANRWKWALICQCHRSIITEEFVLRFKEWVVWRQILSCRQLSDKFIVQNIENVPGGWASVLLRRPMTPYLMRAARATLEPAEIIPHPDERPIFE